MMANWLQRVLSVGVSSPMREKVFLTNGIALCVSVVAFPYVFLFRAYSEVLANVVVVVIGAFLSVFVLNKLGYYALGRFFLILTTNVSAAYYSAAFGQSAGIQYLFFAYLCLPLIVFDFHQPKHIFCGSVIPIACMLYLELSQYYSPTPVTTPDDFQNIIRLTAIAFVSLIILASLTSLIWSLRRSYLILHSQQTLLKRRITAIHEMTADCADLPEWERVCRNIFQYQLNLTPQAWVAKGDAGGDVLVDSRMRGELPSILHTKDDVGRHLLHDIDCFSWIADGVTVLLPVVSGATLQAVIGLSPAEPLSTEDLEFAVMVVGALQKSLQFIRSAETLKTLNMSTFVADNEALFREFRITDRELEIIGMLVQGMSNAQISARLVVTESTTKRHVYNIFQKLGIKSRFELVGWVGDRAVE